MNSTQILSATLAAFVIVTIVYSHITFQEIQRCYSMWFTGEYWTVYNIVDAVAWLAKAIIIIPGLIFGVQVWQLYWIALATSVALIWASYRRVSPTVVGFNTVWCWISCMVLAQHLVS